MPVKNVFVKFSAKENYNESIFFCLKLFKNFKVKFVISRLLFVIELEVKRFFLFPKSMTSD